MKDRTITVAAKISEKPALPPFIIAIYPVNIRLGNKFGERFAPITWAPKNTHGRLKKGKVVRFRVSLSKFEKAGRPTSHAQKIMAQIHDVEPELEEGEAPLVGDMSPLALKILDIIDAKCSSFCLDDETDARNCAVAIAHGLQGRRSNPPRTIYRGSRVSHNIPHGGFQGGLVRPGGFGAKRRPPPVPRRSNPMRSMTYGTMPSDQELEIAFRDGFYYHLKGSDAQTAQRSGIPDIITKANSADWSEMKEILESLIASFEQGDEAAGDLASSFLYVAGIEWV